ncbi:MAG: hypothetical protein PGN13_11205 [Patulibacter minatonensis]
MTTDHLTLPLSAEQLTFLAGVAGTDQLAGIGRRRPLDELEGTVAARSLAARGLIVRGDDAHPAGLSTVAERLVAPLHGEQPHVVVWLRDPAGRVRIAARDAAGRVVVGAGSGGPRARWLLQTAAPLGAIGGLRDALAIALGRPLPGAWEAGYVRRAADGAQQARWLGWRPSVDGTLAVVHQEPGEAPELRHAAPAQLAASFEATLAELSVVPTPAPTETTRPA